MSSPPPKGPFGSDRPGRRQTFKVHLGGNNQIPHLTGQSTKSAREEFFYFNDDGTQFGGVTFKDFPPRQKAASFSVDQVMEKLLEATKS